MFVSIDSGSDASIQPSTSSATNAPIVTTAAITLSLMVYTKVQRVTMSKRGSKRRIGSHDAIDSLLEHVCLQITEVHSDAEDCDEPDEAEVFAREARDRELAYFDNPVVEEVDDDTPGRPQVKAAKRRAKKPNRNIAAMKKTHAAQAARSEKQAIDLATEMLLPPDAAQVHGDVDRQVIDVREAKTKARNLSAQLATAQSACKAALAGDTASKAALEAALAALQSISTEMHKQERRVSVLAERAASNAAQCASLSMQAVAASGRPSPTALPAIVAESNASALIRDVKSAKGNYAQVDPAKHPRYAVRIGARGDMTIGASTAPGPVVLRNGRPMEAYMATSTAHENAAPSSGPTGDRVRANGTLRGTQRRIERTKCAFLASAVDMLAKSDSAGGQQTLPAPTAERQMRIDM